MSQPIDQARRQQEDADARLLQRQAAGRYAVAAERLAALGMVGGAPDAVAEAAEATVAALDHLEPGLSDDALEARIAGDVGRWSRLLADRTPPVLALHAMTHAERVAVAGAGDDATPAP